MWKIFFHIQKFGQIDDEIKSTILNSCNTGAVRLTYIISESFLKFDHLFIARDGEKDVQINQKTRPLKETNV